MSSFLSQKSLIPIDDLEDAGKRRKSNKQQDDDGTGGHGKNYGIDFFAHALIFVGTQFAEDRESQLPVWRLVLVLQHRHTIDELGTDIPELDALILREARAAAGRSCPRLDLYFDAAEPVVVLPVGVGPHDPAVDWVHLLNFDVLPGASEERTEIAKCAE